MVSPDNLIYRIQEDAVIPLFCLMHTALKDGKKLIN